MGSVCEENTVALWDSGQSPREAFEGIVRRHMKDAYFIALGLVGNREDALELSQEAFYRAYKHFDQLNSKGKFFPWFYQILRNLCFSHLRKRRVRRNYQLEVGEGGPQTDGAPANPQSEISNPQSRAPGPGLALFSSIGRAVPAVSPAGPLALFGATLRPRRPSASGLPLWKLALFRTTGPVRSHAARRFPVCPFGRRSGQAPTGTLPRLPRLALFSTSKGGSPVDRARVPASAAGDARYCVSTRGDRHTVLIFPQTPHSAHIWLCFAR